MVKILLVDDDEAIVRQVGLFFDRQGYSYRTAEHGAAAIAVLREEAFDLILSDIKMPVLDGIGLLKHAAEHYPATRVILMTGYSDLESAIAAVQYRAYSFVRKPFNLVEIRMCVERIEHELALQRQLEQQQEQLARSQRLAAQSTLFAGIMHEINNPNTFIYGNADYLQRRLLPLFATPEREQLLIKETGMSRAELVRALNDILTGSNRITDAVERSAWCSQQRTPPARGVVLRDCLERELARVRAEGPAGLQVQAPAPEVALRVLIDEETLQQVIGQLLANARETCRDGEQRNLRVTVQAGNPVVLTVEDDGPGVAADQLSQLFTAFATSKRDRPLRGLGLFTVHQALDAVGGGIRHEACTPHGARFIVTLPAAE